MKFTISETAKLTGVSVRTLHYYDEIGLFTPSEVISDTGYRYYDENAIERLQQILFYKELDFPLKEIVKIMNTPQYSKEQALENQRKLLVLKKERLEKLITLLDSNLKGDQIMSFKEFDMSEIDNAKEKFKKEVADKWGETDAYKECNEKQKNYSKKDYAEMMQKCDDILRKFANHIQDGPESNEVQNLVEEWKAYITKYYYKCTNEILAGLGQMYIADERFTANMDKFEKGTAKLVSDAIGIYCEKNRSRL